MGEPPRDMAADAASVEKRILAVYGELSPGERALADAVLAAPGGISGFSASELAGRAGVSKATAARFFKRLGYDSFREARIAARETRLWGSPLEALSELTAPLETRGSLGRHLANDVANLTRTGERLDPARIDAAVRILGEAERVFVVGFRNSHALATYAYAVLNTVRPGIVPVSTANLGLAELFAGLGPTDAVLAIGFRRRPPVLRRILAAARARGAHGILLTDTAASRSAETADTVLACEVQGAYLFDSYVAAMSLINFLCSALALELGAGVWQRLEDIERLHDALADLAPPAGAQ